MTRLFAGLSVPELVRRTTRGSWEDSVFGQGGRMAFYQFLALFPSLLVFLAIASRSPDFASHVHTAVRDLSSQVLPAQVAQLLREVSMDLNGHGLSTPRFVSASAGALWAAFNSTWAMIYGLNRAYEVKENRRWTTMSITVIALTFVMGAIAAAAVCLVASGTLLENRFHADLAAFRASEWGIVAVAVYLFFTVLYRFAPNAANRRWRCTTPGAFAALILWAGSVLLARFYFTYVNDYSRSYGYLNGVAILLVWLYLSNGAILIGGEMNSEIEKAAKLGRHGQVDNRLSIER